MLNSQKAIVLNHLKLQGSITSWYAIEYYRITRLAAIINDLRKEGYSIVTHKLKNKNIRGKNSKYAKYVYGEPIGVGNTYNLSFA